MSEINPLGGKPDPTAWGDEWVRRFEKAVAARSHGTDRLGVLLSGGLDSRAIVAALPKVRPSTSTLTFGRPGCDDVTTAATVASRVGLRHSVVSMGQGNWLAARQEALWKSDAGTSILHLHGTEGFGLIADAMAVNLSGYVGDLVAGGSYLGEDESDVLEERCRRMVISGLRTIEPEVRNRTPFVAQGVLDLSMAVPRSVRANSGWYNATLARHYPHLFRDIPWQTTGLRPGAPAWQARSWGKIAHVEEKARRWLHLPPSRRLFADYTSWLRIDPVRSSVDRLLTDPRALWPEWFDRGTILSVWHGHLGWGRPATERLGVVISLELWLRRCFDPKWTGL